MVRPQHLWNKQADSTLLLPSPCCVSVDQMFGGLIMLGINWQDLWLNIGFHKQPLVLWIKQAHRTLLLPTPCCISLDEGWSCNLSHYWWDPWLNIGSPTKPTPRRITPTRSLDQTCSLSASTPNTSPRLNRSGVTQEKNPYAFLFYLVLMVLVRCSTYIKACVKIADWEKTLTLCLNRFSATAAAASVASTSLQQSWQHNPHASCCL